MRLRFLRLPTIGLAFLALGAGAVSAANPGVSDKMIVDRVSAYLNTAQSLEGSFVQIAPDGSITDGRFYMKRPSGSRCRNCPQDQK